MINLASDTCTLPTAEMRTAMAKAVDVGDEQEGTDPFVNRLLEMVGELLGKDAALYLPSGTMCNLIALAVHCSRGEGFVVDSSAHVLHAEGGGFAALGGAIPHQVRGKHGVFTPEQFGAARMNGSSYTPGSHLLWIEQTTNLGGGAVWPLDTLQKLCRDAQWEGMTAHMDGARLLNAVVATGVPARDYAAPFDSVWLGLTKGLGAPFGAVLAGDESFIRRAAYWKQRLGGGMRQVGSLAAAAVYALEHHVERLALDHRHAQQLAAGLAVLPGITVQQPVATNIVVFDVRQTGYSALDLQQGMKRLGVKLFTYPPALGEHGLRAVTHLHIGEQEIDETLLAVQQVLDTLPPRTGGGNQQYRY